MGDYMTFKKGDLVTRNSYNNDIVFKITNIEGKVCKLKGVNIRLIADSLLEDLKKYDDSDIEEEKEFLARIKTPVELDRDDYFYLPGKILHLDSDREYLNRCLSYYKDVDIWSIGVVMPEDEMADKIKDLLSEYKPDIVVITGHDAFNRKGKENDINSYKNSIHFVNAIKKAREYEKSHEKLIVIAGGCGSYYEELIKSGANFASSPKRVNIHALDPAIVASKMSLADINKNINLKTILENTKYGKDGMGGIITKGTMYVGYPR
jgi:spore coat assembly protein